MRKPIAMTRSILPAMIAALLVVAIACGGGGDDSGTPSGALPEVTDVAPELDFFGELAAVHSQPVTATFDSESGSLSLADGAAIEVPAGAFPAATELSVAIIDLLFEDYLINPPEARIYVLSTEDDVVLGAPLVLEVPKPSDSVNVSQLVDGEWLPVDVPAGPATRIEIAHFSDNTNVVIDRPSSPPELKPEVGETSGQVAATLLAGCITHVGLFLGETDEYKILSAYEICTKALVNLLARGEKVDVACVGDEIGDEVSIQQAINKCLEKAAKASQEPGPADAADQDGPVWIDEAVASLTADFDAAAAEKYAEHLRWCLPDAESAGLTQDEARDDCQLPWTFEGTGLASVSNSTDFGPEGQNSASYENEPFDVTVTINPDGSLSGTLILFVGISSGTCDHVIPDIRGVREVVEFDPPVVVDYVGTWTAGAFEMKLNPDQNPIYAYNGTYTATAMSGLFEQRQTNEFPCGTVEISDIRSFDEIDRVVD